MKEVATAFKKVATIFEDLSKSLGNGSSRKKEAESFLRKVVEDTTKNLGLMVILDEGRNAMQREVMERGDDSSFYFIRDKKHVPLRRLSKNVFEIDQGKDRAPATSGPPLTPAAEKFLKTICSLGVAGVKDVADVLGVSYKTQIVHVRTLASGGLIEKRGKGRYAATEEGVKRSRNIPS